MMEKNETQIQITPKFIFDMVMRRRWIILSSICLTLIIGITLLFVLPKIYEAKTLIIIESQRVPQSYVQPLISEDTAQRIATIKQQILSTSNLEKIIKDFNLFNEPKHERLFLEDKVADLRKRISVDVIGDKRQTEAFTITFKGKNPDRVMRVANGLASYFINENLKVRESQAEGTSQFLDSQLESMRRKLEKVEEDIKNYRKNHMGELPEQLETNLKIMERLQESLTNKQQQLREAKLRLSDLQNQTGKSGAQIVFIEGSGKTNQPSGTSLEDLRAELQTMQLRYTEKHPDIVRLKSRISALEAEEANSAGDKADYRIPRELRAQISDSRRDVTTTEGEIEDLNRQITEYQQRIEDTPKREQELLGLKRDYQNIQASYDSLLNRKLEADIAVSMERKQKGEQFRVVDPAILPQRPSEPDPRKLFVMVVALGFGIGGGLSFLLEYRNPPFRHPLEIESAYEIPVLTAIPFIQKKRDIILQKLNNVLSIAVTGIACILLMVFGLLSLMGPQIVERLFHI